MSDLRTAAQQALEAWQTATYGHPSHHKATLLAMTALRAALVQQDEPVEPVAWMVYTEGGASAYVTDNPRDLIGAYRALPLYTAPPQRLPLTEEEILKAIGWERAEMYMKLTPNFPIEEARKETIKNARAIERAHGIKE